MRPATAAPPSSARLGQVGHPRPLAAERDRHRDRSGAHGDRHGERIKRVGRYHRSDGRPVVVALISRLEKVPAGCSHDESTGDAHDRQGDTEELKHIRADEQRAEQQEEAVERHPQRKCVAFLLGAVSCQAKENRRAADRVYDREQARVDEQKGISDVVQRRSRRISPCPRDAVAPVGFRKHDCPFLRLWSLCASSTVASSHYRLRSPKSTRPHRERQDPRPLRQRRGRD